MSKAEWFDANRANWDERVPIHLRSYDLTALRQGCGRLDPIEEGEFRVAPGERVLHLQCHFGADTLTLAQRGAIVTGVDFSPAAIAAARALAVEVGLPEARFVEANVYDAPRMLPEPASFDRVFVSWGALCWLPDVVEWAKVVSYYLLPGGQLYLIEGHPSALVFDDLAAGVDGMPGWFAPYFEDGPLVLDDERDYSDPNARLGNRRTYEWMHPIGEIVEALRTNGLAIDFLREHDTVSWRLFAQLVETGGGMYRWPGKRWLPLSFSLSAIKG